LESIINKKHKGAVNMIIVEKPWGYEKWLAYCKEYVMKEIYYLIFQ
jgi:hypothetical protein